MKEEVETAGKCELLASKCDLGAGNWELLELEAGNMESLELGTDLRAEKGELLDGNWKMRWELGT